VRLDAQIHASCVLLALCALFVCGVTRRTGFMGGAPRYYPPTEESNARARGIGASRGDAGRREGRIRRELRWRRGSGRREPSAAMSNWIKRPRWRPEQVLLLAGHAVVGEAVQEGIVEAFDGDQVLIVEVDHAPQVIWERVDG
jgi:hypothetical protein